ncbi:conserved hypothetical protein [Ricinus communis]|uniref:Uncharacterized protein n=1 Tax=Ricinus communis TaxID=3988 RepID=B9SUF0_RICCO|nr:conserved hypothetical protein [Ricinus communis]
MEKRSLKFICFMQIIIPEESWLSFDEEALILHGGQDHELGLEVAACFTGCFTVSLRKKSGKSRLAGWKEA